MKYTAQISRNFRDTNLSTPKVLLRNITDEEGNLFRDHAWVALTHRIEGVLPRSGDNKSYTIEFHAKPKTYVTEGPRKNTLCKIRNITRL